MGPLVQWRIEIAYVLIIAALCLAQVRESISIDIEGNHSILVACCVNGLIDVLVLVLILVL